MGRMRLPPRPPTCARAAARPSAAAWRRGWKPAGAPPIRRAWWCPMPRWVAATARPAWPSSSIGSGRRRGGCIAGPFVRLVPADEDAERHVLLAPPGGGLGEHLEGDGEGLGLGAVQAL